MAGGPPSLVPSSRPRVLVVDDEDALRRAIIGWLKFGGFDPVEAADGLQAVRLLEGGTFEAVVTDVVMPGMNGIELLRAVRERDLDLPVLVMSGAPDTDSAAEAVRYGAAEYIIKPFELSVLEAIDPVGGSRPGDGRCSGRRAQAVEDFPCRLLVEDERDEPQAPAAGARKGIDVVDPLQELGPVDARRRCAQSERRDMHGADWGSAGGTGLGTRTTGCDCAGRGPS